ncbi:serine/threonine-protein kinase [Kitasatospora sp. NPDC048365]|uniref:serine/threonine-protein kinase n=1 Tax=Kitasatospora sp. NPDC048365 TaxID=3364050 RepID=UPI0037244D67
MTQPQKSTGRLLAGRYRLNDVLGRGGMGTVWRAEDEMLGRIVAVKELRMTGAVDEDEKHRLIVRTLREAKATARIRHTAAVTVFDVVEEDERPWIVMELVESRSLAEVIKDDGTLTPVRAAEIALDLLGVLGAAHAQGVLHRDVKPSNVLIGEDGRVVLTDFGIASVEGDTSITSTGMLVGAPSYISPERARGQKPGPPADLWSLGGTLYAMVEGKPPYDRGSALATLTAVMTEELETPANAGPLAPVIEGLLAKDPAERLDAAATRAMLKRIVADGAARAEATTQQAVPAPVAAAAGAAASGSAAKAKADGAAKAGAEQASRAPQGAARPATASRGVSVRRAPGAVRGGSAAGGAVAAAGGAGGAGVPHGADVVSGAPAPAAGVGAPGAANAVVEPAEAETGLFAAVGVRLTADRRRTALLAGAALVAVLALVAGLVALLGDGDPDGRTSADGAPASASAQASAAGTAGTGGTGASGTPGAPASPAASTPAPAASPQGGGSSQGGGAASGGTSAGGTLPAGFATFKDASGFSIALPDWLADKGPDYDETSRRFEGRGVRLVIDWRSPAGGSALKDWQDSDRSANFSNYRRVRVEGMTFRTWTNAADWEWTYSGKSGATQHSLNRGFVTGGGKYGYAIYWTMPESDWSLPANSQARQVSYDTFEPAP